MEHFSINPLMGIVSLRKQVDRERQPEFNITIYAHDQVGSIYSTLTCFKVFSTGTHCWPSKKQGNRWTGKDHPSSTSLYPLEDRSSISCIKNGLFESCFLLRFGGGSLKDIYKAVIRSQEQQPQLI